MKIIEQYISGKTASLNNCEDAIFISSDFASVIDGATNLTWKKKKEKPGKLSSKIIMKALSVMPRKIASRKAIDFLTNALNEYYEREGIKERLKNNPERRCASSVIIYSQYRKEIWMVGDCQCLIGRKHYQNKKNIDHLLSELRSFFIMFELNSGANISDIARHDAGREAIELFLKIQSSFQNNKKTTCFSYGAIDGFYVPTKYITELPVSFETDIVLASDGYPKLYSSLKKSEDYLKKLLAIDPLMFKVHPSTKGLVDGDLSYDDRAYIKIHV